MKTRTLRLIALFTPAVVFLASSAALAQTNGGTGKGLDHLNEQDVMTTLASNNMETLLDRDFSKFDIPADKQDGVRVFIQIRELINPLGLNIADRRRLAVKVAKGLDSHMAKSTDPKELMEEANQLTSYGIMPEVAQLEYFGENPIAQADLKPVADTAKKLYTQASVMADKKKNAFSSQIKNNADFTRLQPQLLAMDNIKTNGEYFGNQLAYAQCISLPKVSDRAAVADPSIAYFKGIDDPTNGVQPEVRLAVGKLQLAKGEFKDAIATLQSIVNDKEIKPAPTLAQQNNARYFSVVCMIGQHQLPDAERSISELESWESQNFMPTLKNPGEQDAVTASLQMLKFRLYSAQSDITMIDEDKKQKNNQAIEVLGNLLRAQPGLKDLVFDQLLGRIPDQPVFADLNPLILQALQEQAYPMVREKDPVAVDEKIMKRSIAAAREIVSRKGSAGIDDAQVTFSSFFTGVALEKLKDDKQAAAAWMDFAEKFPQDKNKSNYAMDRASGLVGALRAKDKTDQETRKLYDRFLPLAINPPYNRKQFAFQYASLLLTEKKPKEAVTFYKMIPESDHNYKSAQYIEMLALVEQLSDQALSPDERADLVKQILEQRTRVDSFLAGATTPEEKKLWADHVVQADEIAADLTRSDLKDPAKSLEILEGFEDRAAASTDPAKAHIDALTLRVSAYMAQGNVHDATTSLVKLLDVNPIQGQGLMFGVLKSIEKDMGDTKDPAVLKKLAQDKAALSGFVVDYAAKSKDPKEQEMLPTYQLYDADSKRQAAELNDNAAAKQQGLLAALKAYQDLFNKDNNNAAAQEGIGLTNFSLGNFPEALKALGPLINGNKVGQPMEEGPPGTTQKVENPQFWEANYKDCRSVVEVFRKNPKDETNQKYLEATRQYVEFLYINNGKNTGGKLYKDEFDKLRADIAGLQSGKIK